MTGMSHKVLYVLASHPYRLTVTVECVTKRKIDGFRTLPDGWYYGEGKAIPDQICDVGVAVLQEMHLLGLTRTDAFPGPGGELMVAAYHGKHCIEVVIEKNGHYQIVHEINGDEIWMDKVIGERSVKSLLRQRAWEIFGKEWRSYDSSTTSTSTINAVASSAWRSRIPPTEAERLLSMRAA